MHWGCVLIESLIDPHICHKGSEYMYSKHSDQLYQMLFSVTIKQLTALFPLVNNYDVYHICILKLMSGIEQVQHSYVFVNLIL